MLPKLSSGSTPPRPPLGASSIHSADECEEVYCTLFWYEPPVVLFVNDTCQVLLPLSSRETDTESPAWTPSGTGWENCGSISIQASYSCRPELRMVSSVPAWMRSRLRSPPMPTQAASAPTPEPEPLTCGTVHVALTAVKVPPLAA